MTARERLLLETLIGHFALLKTAHPRKANSPLARRARRAVQLTLRGQTSRHRKAA